MEIIITNDEYYKHENLIEMRQMTLNDPKFDIKKSPDTLKEFSGGKLNRWLTNIMTEELGWFLLISIL